MRPQLLVAACLMLMTTGCLRRFIAQESKYLLASRYVYDQPVEEVWPAVRDVLAADGYSIQESSGSYEILTEWRSENASSMLVSTASRYLVLAERLEADRCIVRFVRLNRLPQGSEDYQRGEYQSGGPNAFTKAQLNGRREVLKSTDGKASPAEMTSSRRDLKMEWKLLARARPDIAAQSEAEIDRQLPAWLGEDPESLRGLKVAQKVAAPTVRPELALEPPPVPAAGGPEVVTAPPAPASAPGECPPPVHGEEALLQKGRLVIFGETPGTHEIPQFVGGVTCRAARAGLQVVVGLEIPFDEQGALANYVASPGSKEDRKAMLRSGFWRRAWQDGRSSEAVVALIEQVRLYREQGRQVSVWPFDARGLGGNARQASMAAHVAEARVKNPDALILVLTGNVQARIVSGTSWDSSLVPMAVRLLEVDPKLVSLDAHYSGGSAWTCRMADGGTTACSDGFLPAPQRTRILGRGMGSNKEAKGLETHATYVNLDQEAAGGAHHGIFYLGKVSAAPPAVNDPKAWTVLR